MTIQIKGHSHCPCKEDEKTVFGFWIYLLTDLMFFAILFATYSVFSRGGTFGEITPKEIFSLPFGVKQTLVMLLSAFSAGMGGVCAHRQLKEGAVAFFSLTFCIGLVFLQGMGKEFSSVFAQGYDWTSTAFLSMYFTLMGTFALHLVFGLLWILLFVILLLKEEGISSRTLSRLTCLRLFWQFMNLIWGLLFTFVYLLGGV